MQVVRIGPDGSVYAAALPSGKVYKLNASATEKVDEQKATVVFDASKLETIPAGGADAAKADDPPAEKNDSKSHYVWDMTFDAAGRLYIATGGPGAVYRVDTSRSRVASRELLFQER